VTAGDGLDDSLHSEAPILTTDSDEAADEAAVLGRLSALDRFLPLWIGMAMVGGLVLGSLVPGLNDGLDHLRVGTVSLPIALGLLLMMYPVLPKVRYEQLGKLRGDRPLFAVSLLLGWVVGPLLMFALAWLFLADQPAYRTGVIIVGLTSTPRKETKTALGGRSSPSSLQASPPPNSCTPSPTGSAPASQPNPLKRNDVRVTPPGDVRSDKRRRC
jgi:hypothetical protein